MYMPKLARFTARDPLPTNGVVVGGLPQYVYATNNPINRFDPSGCVPEDIKNATQADLKYCEHLLKTIALTHKFGVDVYPCAGVLLGQFIYGKPGRNDPCPKPCRTALKQYFSKSGNFLDQQLESVGHDLANCPQLWIPARGQISGTFAFEKSNSSADLFFAFHGVSWTLNYQCELFCPPTMLPTCCCECEIKCFYRIRIKDTYDFCSSLPKDTPKRSPAWCGCLFEHLGYGKPYQVSCTLEDSRKREFIHCEDPETIIA